MAIYQRPETSFWYYEFKLDGKRHRGSTRTADRPKALAFEAARRLEATQASQRLREENEAATQSMAMWDVAQSWLALSEKMHADHKGNLSRVRKLFGREMRLIGGKWEETGSGRYGLRKTITVREVTPGALEILRVARRREGNSPGTIEREMALIQALLAHVGVRLPYKPTKSARERVNKVLALPARPEPPEALGCGFSASQYEAVAALRLRLERSLGTPVTLRIAVGEPHRVAHADEAGGGYTSEPGDFKRDQRLRMTLWAEAPRPAEGTRWPLVSFPADAPDFVALLDAAWSEASYAWEALTRPAAVESHPDSGSRVTTLALAAAPASRLVQMMQARAARRQAQRPR